MKTIPLATSNYLLEISLEALHAQSVEWLKSIAFLRDETAFLYALELKETLKSVPVTEKSAIQKIENELVRMTGKDLDKLDDEIEKHEVNLYRLLTTHSGDEAHYREIHENLAARVEKIEQRMKTLKMEIFRLVKLNKENAKMGVTGNRDPAHPEMQM